MARHVIAIQPRAGGKRRGIQIVGVLDVELTEVEIAARVPFGVASVSRILPSLIGREWVEKRTVIIDMKRVTLYRRQGEPLTRTEGVEVGKKARSRRVRAGI